VSHQTTFTCHLVDQTPGVWFWTRPGLQHHFTVRYTNTGTAIWNNHQDVSDLSSVELWACDANGNIHNSPLVPVHWVGENNPYRVTGANEALVPHNSIATFEFDAQIPAMQSGDIYAYFRPTHHGQNDMPEWVGMNFPMHVDADAPQAPPGLAVNPTACSINNSFTFNWAASSDPGSGVESYAWKVNGEAEVLTTGYSAGPRTAPNQGWNTFYVRAKDRVGNWSGYSSVQFCWQPADGWNPSFETDADQNGIPDGWSLICVNGAGFERRSDGSPDGSSHTMRFVDNDGDDWSAMGRHTGNTLLYSGVIYRISFWYRAWSNAPFGWQMSTPNLQSYINVLNCTVSDPLADAAWHHFWGAPFMLSGSDLTDYPYMTFKHGQNAIGTVDIDGVVIEQVSLCQ
jgi:hypothetical protein